MAKIKAKASNAQVNPEMVRVSRLARKAVTAVAGLLALTFTWLKFSDVPFGPIFLSVSATVIFHFALALYYFCWMAGLVNDTQEQELVYTHAPKHTVRDCVVYGLVFFLVFGALCYVDVNQFCIALAIFIVANVLAWQWLVRVFLKRAVRETRRQRRADNDFVGVEKLRTVYNEYLCGGWQWARFAVGGAIVTMLLLVTFVPPIRLRFEQMQVGSSEMVTALLLLLFVVVMEAWIWIMRLRMKFQLSLLQGIAKRYGNTLGAFPARTAMDDAAFMES